MMGSPPLLAHPRTRRGGRRAPLRLLSLVALIAAPGAAGAQDASTRRAWIVEPSVGLRETLTDNHRLRTPKEADSITEASAGIRLTGTGTSIRGFLDYTLTGVAYARHSGLNEFRNNLNSQASAELIDRRLYLDARGNIGQQSISAFGTQSADPSLANNNRTEVATYAISPYLRGRLAGQADYEVRLIHEGVRAEDAAVSDVTNNSALVHLDGGSRVAGWTADLSHNIADYEHRSSHRGNLGAGRAALCLCRAVDAVGHRGARIERSCQPGEAIAHNLGLAGELGPVAANVDVGQLRPPILRQRTFIDFHAPHRPYSVDLHRYA